MTASGTSCPLLKNAMYEVMTSIATGITPLIKSVVIGAPPRYGTCTRLTPAFILSQGATVQHLAPCNNFLVFHKQRH